MSSRGISERHGGGSSFRGATSPRSQRNPESPSKRPPPGTTSDRRMFSFAEPSNSKGQSSRRLLGGGPSDSFKDFDDAPFESEEWMSKLSRQRHFDDRHLPMVHERAYIARQLLAEEDDGEREEQFAEMSGHLDDMSGFVEEFVERKEEEIERFQEMFDENGNPIERFDENGNPLPAYDEDGYATYSDKPRKSNKYTVTFKTDHLLRTEGWIHKKGSGEGARGRRNWVKRYFKIDMARPFDIYMYRKAPPPCAPRNPDYETVEQYKRRKARQTRAERVHARARINLDGAEIFVPYADRRHKNRRVKSEFEFDVVQAKGRTFQMFVDTEEEMELWIRTFEYIINTVADAKAASKNKLTRSSKRKLMEIDEAKRDAAQCCTAFGKGLFEATAGQPAEFVIQASDEIGTPDVEGGREFGVVLESQDLHYDLEVKDNDDGTYSVRYVPTRVGTYELSILLDDYDVAGSPFHPTVNVAPVSAPNCVGEGAGLFCSVVGIVNEFVIQTRNSFNQHVSATGAPFVLRVRNGKAAQCVKFVDDSPIDRGDGTYMVRYVLEPNEAVMEKLSKNEPVDAWFEILLDDGIHNPSFERHIKGSPFKAVVAASATGAALAAAARNAAQHMSFGAQASLLSQFASLGGAAPARVVEASAPRPVHPPQRSAPVPQRSPPVHTLEESSSSYLPFDSVAPSSFSNDMSSERALLEREREELRRMRRELETERQAMDGEVSRLSAAGKNARRAADDLADRARVLGEAAMNKYSEQFNSSESTYTQPRNREMFSSFEAPPKQRSNAAATTRLDASTFSDVQSTYEKSFEALPESTRSFDSVSMGLFRKHESVLRKVYRHYGARDGLEDGREVVRMPGFTRMAAEYDVSPTFVSRKELREAFAVASGGADALDFARFCEALGHVAVQALSKPMFAHLYSTTASKISVVLEIWGLGDAHKLETMRRRDSYR